MFGLHFVGGGAINGREDLLCHGAIDYTNGVLFQVLTSPENLFLSWRMFAHDKGKRKDVQAFKRHLEENIFDLREELVNGTYRHGEYSPFTISDPKTRNIHKATVRDRVVHQAIFNIINPLFDPRFIADSFSCRVGKCTHAASRRLRHFLNTASNHGHKNVYALKCDIKKYFDSIDHQILFSLIRRQVQDEKILDLITHTLNSFEKTPGKGLPLGNLTSQLFANVYLHELDHFVKHTLRVKHYLRYCDDFLIVGESPEKLRNYLKPISEFLKERLQLQLHPNKLSLRSIGQGIDFVGYVHLRYATVLRGTTKKRMLQKVTEKNFTSYLGLCKHADTYELQRVVLSLVGGAVIGARQ